MFVYVIYYYNIRYRSIRYHYIIILIHVIRYILYLLMYYNTLYLSVISLNSFIYKVLKIIYYLIDNTVYLVKFGLLYLKLLFVL